MPTHIPFPSIKDTAHLSFISESHYMLLSFRLDGFLILTRNWSYSRINEVVLSRFIQVLYRL